MMAIARPASDAVVSRRELRMPDTLIRLDRPHDAQDVHDARQIVGKHAERHLGTHVLQPLHQEVRCRPCAPSWCQRGARRSRGADASRAVSPARRLLAGFQDISVLDQRCSTRRSLPGDAFVLDGTTQGRCWSNHRRMASPAQCVSFPRAVMSRLRRWPCARHVFRTRSQGSKKRSLRGFQISSLIFRQRLTSRSH